MNSRRKQKQLQQQKWKKKCKTLNEIKNTNRRYDGRDIDEAKKQIVSIPFVARFYLFFFLFARTKFIFDHVSAPIACFYCCFEYFNNILFRRRRCFRRFADLLSDKYMSIRQQAINRQ